MLNYEIGNNQDILDVRDLIEALEGLEDAENRDEDEEQEYQALTGLLDDLRSMGGNHQWRGAWYPGTLIRDSYFTEYAQDLAEDIGAIKDRSVDWPNSFIDWAAAAAALQQDYSETEYDGVTYWYR